MAEEIQSIECVAAVYKVQTLVDGGIRVTLDLPEQATLEAAQLMVCQAKGIVLRAVLMPIEDTPTNGGTRIVSRRAAKQRVG